MTTTAVQVAEIGLKRLLVQGADAPLEADEYQDFFDAMNNYMAELEADGVVLGYTPVSAAADVVTVPPGAINAIAHNVAIDVASDYGAAVSGSLMRAASRGRRLLYKIGSKRPRASLHPNLPLGSGNRGHTSAYTATTYGVTMLGTMTLAGNALVTDMGGTTNNLVKVNGFWKLQRQRSVDLDITGRMTSTVDGEATITVKVTFTAKATGSVSAAKFAIVKNGDSSDVPSGQTMITALSSAQSDHALRVPIRLLPGEYAEFWAGDTTGSENITVTDAVWEVS